MTILDISIKLGFHKGTIYREFKRNSIKNTYSPVVATRLSKVRFKKCRKKFKIQADIEYLIEKYLKQGWSPQQLSGRIYLEINKKISFQNIYFYLRTQRRDLKHHLRRDKKRGAGRLLQKRSRNQNRLMIKLRPKVVSDRSRFGDWERDGMYLANRAQLLIFTERKSRYTKITSMKSIRPKDVTDLTKDVLKNDLVHTITNDNGPEFRDSKSLPYPAYHCDPGKPQQRGTVENTIGLLRQYLTNKTDLAKLKEDDLITIQNKLNLRPRKCLNYRTPFEVFNNVTVALAI